MDGNNSKLYTLSTMIFPGGTYPDLREIVKVEIMPHGNTSVYNSIHHGQVIFSFIVSLIAFYTKFIPQ